MSQNFSDKVNEGMPNTEVGRQSQAQAIQRSWKSNASCGKWMPARGQGRSVRCCAAKGSIILSDDLAPGSGGERRTGRINARKRGPKPNPEAIELAKLRRAYERLQERMRQAELIIEVQKKVALMLGANLEAPDLDDLS